jgi:ADP-heptose:LPS heptosyltransferase
MTELERETLAAIAGSRLRDVQGLDLTDDFAGMAAACLACDLVVSVGTALAELSGAVGARTLLALPHTSAIAQGRAGPDGSDRYWPAARCLARAHGENRQQFSARLADAAVRSLNGGRR